MMIRSLITCHFLLYAVRNMLHYIECGRIAMHVYQKALLDNYSLWKMLQFDIEYVATPLLKNILSDGWQPSYWTEIKG